MDGVARWFPGDLRTGMRIAGYELEERVGTGGMAVVFRARDDRLNRQVALKFLLHGTEADGTFRQRFLRESCAAAAIDHPHIVPVFAAGEADGALFIAMWYVPSGDLRTDAPGGSAFASPGGRDRFLGSFCFGCGPGWCTVMSSRPTFWSMRNPAIT